MAKVNRIGLISSPGGHLRLMVALHNWWGKYPRFWVTHELVEKTGELRGEKLYYGHFPENRSVINLFRNLFLAIQILYKERPTLLISSGAGIAVPFFWIGRLFGCQLVFIETFSLIPKQTLSGKMVYPICHKFFIQDRKMLKGYPKAHVCGQIL